MNCANHADIAAVAYCRTCGKPLCSTCVRDVRGVVYCEECLASHLSAVIPPGAAAVPPGAEPLPGSPSPGLALGLGFIPGVGAMYNGEFAKGFLHVLIFATLIWLTDTFQASNLDVIFGLAIAAFYFYMPIEAYKTARARQMGLPPPDPLGLNNVFGGRNVWHDMFVSGPSQAPAVGAAPLPQMPEEERSCSRTPIGAVILIGIGVLFLLDEFNWLHFDWILQRFWPLILIAVGIRLLMVRRRKSW